MKQEDIYVKEELNYIVWQLRTQLESLRTLRRLGKIDASKSQAICNLSYLIMEIEYTK